MLRMKFPSRLRDRLKYGRPGLGERGAIGVMFGFALVPMTAIVGLAVDYSFYVSARAQLNLAADAAALHAVRVASQNFSTSHDSAKAQAAGILAGKQWWAAQLGNLGYGTVDNNRTTVNVTYTSSPSSWTASLNYNGTVNTHFGTLFSQASSPIKGAASAVITNSYVEVLMLLDASPSMLLGASATDIVALEQATPCSTQSALAGQNMSNYAWVYPAPYSWTSKATVPPVIPAGSSTKAPGYCDPQYTGDASACFYVPWTPIQMPINSAGQCVNASGAPTGGGQGAYGPNTPQAPCAFACHTSSTQVPITTYGVVTDPVTKKSTVTSKTSTQYDDYYGLARALGITLRLDVVQQAARNVVTTLQNDIEAPNQFSVGIYQFDTDMHRVFPASGEASTDLASAVTAVNNLQIAVNPNNVASTNFAVSANSLYNIPVTAGSTNGTSASAPQKNLFIVTDGMEDHLGVLGGRTIGPMTSASNETICQQFKDKNFAVYVLYTRYLPVPNPWYFSNVKHYAEPTDSSPNVQALQACASSPANFFVATDGTQINNAMQAMLKSALNSAGRISQ